MKLSPIQEKIVETPGNLIVRASAGTGKTHTMVNKIAKEIDDNHTHKVIAAITFTIKAAQEIKDRLSVDVVQHFIGTNNSFVIEEVIKPFMKDVYGADFDLDMSTDYSAKVDTFQEAIEKIRNEGILCSYRDNKRNFIFDLAQKIVENSSACRLYLQAKYFKIYIDEYQDCDKSMHKFFMYLCDELNIETFVVGDEKQSIYIWRGAYPEAFKSIWNKPNFKKIFMGDNFRSCQQIQNYSNLLCDETRSLYNPTENIDNIVWLSPTKANWATEVLSNIVPDKKSALLRFSNDNARIGASELTTNGLEYVYIPQTPIADITTDTAWLYTAIAKYLIIEKYSAYDVISEIPVEGNESRKTVSTVKRLLKRIEETICSMKYITDDVLKRAFVTMMNKLVFGHQIVLRPLLQSLRGMNDKSQLLKMQDLESQIEKNMEQRQVLTSLMAGGYLEPALFNKESNALAVEAEALRQEKDSLMHSLNGNMVKTDELQKLFRFVSKGIMMDGFDDEAFLTYVDSITIHSRSEAAFELKCGVSLKERLVD